jgi:hypothetical protein
MTVQELINKLNKIENKNRLVVYNYDAWYDILENIHEIILHTDDDCINLYDEDWTDFTTKEAKDYIPVECILIN